MTDFPLPLKFKLAQAQRATNSSRQLATPRLMRGLIPLPALGVTLTGQSLDNTGAAVGFVTCTLFRVVESVVDSPAGAKQYVQVGQTVSDAGGNYSFPVGFDGPFRVTFDLAGAPIRAGITLNTLAGV